MESLVPGFRRDSKVTVIHRLPFFFTAPTPTKVKAELRIFALWPALFIMLRWRERTPRGVRPTFSPRLFHLVTLQVSTLGEVWKSVRCLTIELV
jgi:hypothetical protein